MNFQVTLTKSELRSLYPTFTEEGIDSRDLQSFIDEATTTIWNYISTHSSINWLNKSLSSYRIKQLKAAIASQTAYSYHAGLSLTHSAGIGIEGSFIPADEMEKRQICPEARQILFRAGFLYRGLYQ